MASIRKRGSSYLLVVSMGYDYEGNRIKPRQRTVHPPEELTNRQKEKWLNEQAVLFERECKGLPQEVDRSITLAKYTELWFQTIAPGKLAKSTLARDRLHGLCSMVRFLLRAGNLHDTLDHLMQKPCLRGVGSAVVDLLALAARDDQPACFQRAQMMRDGRAGHVHHCRDIDHARLAVAQQPENPHARRISQLAEYVRNCLKFFRLLQFPA